MEALCAVTEEDNQKAKELVEKDIVTVKLDHIGSQITIDALVETDMDSCQVKIAGGHTDIYYIEKKGDILVEKERAWEAVEKEPLMHQYTLKE